ncbi:MAG: RNA polymerase factor sigma-32 [Sandaracinaceae bacterium]|nr:RNA polymerase factor sigma-32 [Sandaracinaceae bacterium]
MSKRNPSKKKTKDALVASKEALALRNGPHQEVLEPSEERDWNEASAELSDEELSDEEIASSLDGIDGFEEVEVPSSSTAIVKSEEDGSSIDPLQAYIRDIQRYPLLTPEEMQALAIRYATTGDIEAARKLVTSNLRLVVKIAYDYRRAYRNILDLIQEGNIGLMQAVKRYDPSRGVKLSSYAAWWIRAYILRFILNNWRLVKIGTTQAQRKLFFNLKKEKNRLAAMGIEPTAELIAANLDVPTEEVIAMDRRLSGSELLLDVPVSTNVEGKPTMRVDALPSGDRSIDESLAHGEIHEIISQKLHEFGKTLTGKDAIIFHERLIAEEPKTLQELGDRFGISRERVRQIEKRLQDRIRSFLEAHIEKSALIP